MLTWNSGTLRSSKLFGKQNITCHKSGYFCWKLESGQQICPSWKGGFQPAQDTDFNGRIGRCWTSSKPRLSIPVSRILSSGRLGDLSNISVRLRLKWAMGQYYFFTAHIRPCLILEPDVFLGNWCNPLLRVDSETMRLLSISMDCCNTIRGKWKFGE